jgi:flagellar biosynthesis protein FlhF
MRLKLYRAGGVAEAMAQVRADLGVDALILATRRVGNGVEVTAALEPDEEELPPLRVPEARIPEARVPEAGRLAALRFHGVPAALLDGLLHGDLTEAISAAVAFAALDLSPGSRPLLLAGPPGAGKTLSAARLAARLVMAGESPMVITADGRRAGATEQLAAFTRLLGLNLVAASHPVMLGRALARRPPGVPVLIDAPGTDPFDPTQREEIAALAATVNAVVAVVVPAGMDPAEAADIACVFAEAGASMLIVTRLDITRRLGGVLAAGSQSGLSLAEAGIGPGAADGMVALTPALLSRRLMQTKPPAPERLQ